MKLFKKKNIFLKIFEKKTPLEKFYNKNKEFIDYSIVSTFCTIILYALYFFITWITKGNYIFANFVAYVVSFSILFILDQKIFKSKPFRRRDRVYQLIMFIFLRVIGFVIDSSILVFFIEHAKLSKMTSKIMSSLITFTFNYVTNKLFVFQHKKLI